jgi:hypothetical protein
MEDVVSAAHRWLDLENRPTEPLPRDELEARIERVLTLTNIGFMATIGKNGPIASPVEFYSQDLDIYVYPQPNSPKIKALQRDPRMSFAVANPMAGWASAFGVQMFGNAELLEPGSRHDGVQVPGLQLGSGSPGRHHPARAAAAASP